MADTKPDIPLDLSLFDTAMPAAIPSVQHPLDPRLAPEPEPERLVEIAHLRADRDHVLHMIA